MRIPGICFARFNRRTVIIIACPMSSSHLLIILSVRFDVVFIAAIRSRNSLSKVRKYSINRTTEWRTIFYMNGINERFCVAVTEVAICESRRWKNKWLIHIRFYLIVFNISSNNSFLYSITEINELICLFVGLSLFVLLSFP